MGYPSLEMEADAGNGASTGQAMQSLTQLVDKMPEVGLAWSGIAYQERESSNQAVWLYVISVVFIFCVLQHFMKAGRFRVSSWLLFRLG